MNKKLTVGYLLSMLRNIVDNREIDQDYTIAVWIPERSGSEAKDLSLGFPDIDHNDKFLAFKLSNPD